ncbi:MAG: arylesterase [Gammaproteobacteria bacterium]|nr:arylesterase [Gammaproteobacteria bacterium]
MKNQYSLRDTDVIPCQRRGLTGPALYLLTRRTVGHFTWCIAILCSVVFTPTVSSAAEPHPVVLILGDSISAAYGINREDGWVALLETRLRSAHPQGRVINASISGETTGGGLARLPRALAEHAPHVVILELGGNDGLRGYPIKRMQANLQQMIDLTLAAKAKPLLVGMQIPPNYGARYTAAFSGAYSALAKTNDIALVRFLLQDVALKKGWMQSDGIHPTREAQPAMLDAVWPVLAPLLARGD